MFYGITWQKHERNYNNVNAFLSFQTSCEALSAYLSDTLNPYFANVTSAAQLCSKSLCQGKGRCVRCWTSNVLHVQNWRKAIYKKYWNLLIRNYSAGLFSGTSLTKKQPRNTFLQSLYSMHRRVSASHWLGIRPGLLQSTPTFLSFCPDAVSAFLQK